MTFAMPAQPQPYLGYDYQPQMGWPQTPDIAPGGASADYSVFRQEGNAAERQVIQSSYFQDEQAPAMSDVATGQSSAAGKGTNGGGYIDNAQIRSMLRLRLDGGFDLNRPDRAEFFYASWANLSDHPHAIKDTNQILSAVNNRGALRIPENVDFQLASSQANYSSNASRTITPSWDKRNIGPRLMVEQTRATSRSTGRA